jgi:DNA-directed RNA polymerase specialized sigma24 family protein
MLTYRRGKSARRGGLDLVISLTPEQVEALGGRDAVELGEALDTLLVGVAVLRAAQRTDAPAGSGADLKDPSVEGELDWTERLIYDLFYLRERVAGASRAAIRLHEEQGGTYGELADAMGVTRATAQRRRDSVTRATPNRQERWAITWPAREEKQDDDIHAPGSAGSHQDRGSLGGPGDGPNPDQLD